MLPDITVLMPNYNNGPFLNEAIDSILKQTFTNFIFLIIDDGSTDNSIEIITSYTDSRIKLIRKENNSGIVEALNIGLKQVQSKYIVRMDGDDVSSPDRLEKLFNFMEQNPEIGVCGSQMQYFGNENHRSNYYTTPDKIKAQLIYGTGISHPASIFRSSVLKNHNLSYRKNHPYMEDYDLFFRLKKHTDFANINSVLFNYRILQHNSTVVNRHTRYDRYENMYKDVLNELNIPFSKRNLDLHLDFFLRHTLIHDIREYRMWIDYLLLKNKEMDIYPQKALEDLLKEKWEHFFFKVVPLSMNQIFRYFLVSKKINYNHFSYFVKYKINKLIGRNC